MCLTIPLGTHFQFRSLGPGPLAAVAVTMPPWPGPDEAVPVARHVVADRAGGLIARRSLQAADRAASIALDTLVRNAIALGSECGALVAGHREQRAPRSAWRSADHRTRRQAGVEKPRASQARPGG